ncbi:MAG: DUF896 domain-containing protein [Corallococcus sp.]|nr:DUF896 domain-containing protein [Bacillota bacterium]MCM1533266.1 DUF896 domain-containing protein [Corallococcus sp.]
MEQSKIDRINELARKSKTAEGLTDGEKAEQAALRKEYIDDWRRGVQQTLDNTYVVDEHGNERKLRKKPDYKE